MKQKWLGLLAGLALAGCGQQLELSPDVALTHEHEAAFQAQAQRLHAGQVRLTVANDGKVLLLEVRDVPRELQRPDTLKQRVQKLARLLAADLAHPTRYEAVNVQVREHTGFFDKQEGSLQFFIYPLSALR